MAPHENSLMGNSPAQRLRFVPTADAAILTSKHPLPPARPATVGPIFDPHNVNEPIDPWSSDVEGTFYPPTEPYAPAAIPDKPPGFNDRYLRAFLADNERLRLSMLWYYTRDVLQQDELLSGLQEKVHLAQEFTGWEFAVIGILDVNVYIRLATVGLDLGILPRGETICAHTVTQPPGSVFLMPNLMEDWRFQKSPYLELGGLRAYAGAPLRLQTEFGECVSLGSLCVASSKSEEPLTKTQHQALVRLADWVISDLVQSARARRQRERRQMSELLSQAQKETDATVSEEPVLGILAAMYPNAVATVQLDVDGYVKTEGHEPIPLADFENHLWEDTDYLNEFITNSNHLPPPSSKVVRIIASPCEILSGASLLLVASKDYQFVFDDVDLWFVHACASMISEMWRKRLLLEAMTAKEKFLRGFSHQLRTPIHGILGSVDLLTEEMRSVGAGDEAMAPSPLTTKPTAIDSKKLSNYLGIIKMAGQDLTSIVNNMITLNRWADIAIADRHYAMHTVIELETEIEREILKLTSADSRYRTSIFLTHDLPSGCEQFKTDLSVLCDSLLPLVTNAIQNTPNGIVSINISISADGGQLVVDVEDTGRGIPQEHQKRIFEPYEKVDALAPGAGLGLTLASRFATLLHGSVELILSAPSCGSHFRATFPAMQCASSSTPSQLLSSKWDKLPAKFSQITTGSEDEPVYNRFSRMLMQHGFMVSNRPEDCFFVFEAASDPVEHEERLSQIPPGHVGICLVPAAESEKHIEPIVNNVLYTSGLFSTSTLCALLEKAQTLFLDTVVSPAQLLPPEKPLVVITSKCMDACTEEVSESTSSPDSDTPITPTTLPIISQPNGTVLVEEKHVAPDCLSISPPCQPMVLIVDDNAVNLRIMEMYCRKRGLLFRSAMDGQQAVEHFSQQQSVSAAGMDPPIQLIFMDLQMPVCDGIEATRQIRSLEEQNHWGRSLVIVMTGQDTTADRAAADGAGADEYFVKPVVITKLDHILTEYFPGFNIR